MKPHKHAELIKAWAEGKIIESKHRDDPIGWFEDSEPWWGDDMYEFRIKPGPKPDVVKFLNKLKNKFVDGNVCWEESDYKITHYCIAITYDGETGKPKSAEVLK